MAKSGFSARLHGKDCSCNPLAFPPSLAVRRRRYESMEGRGRATHEAKADESMEGRGRTESGTEVESNAGAVAE